MRQVALTAILNQIGSFVPAQSAKLPVFDRIFTRVGASDDLARGQSTFMVEMAESANILRHASPKSLVILDEVGRGTSTRDGLAIAAAILQDLTLRVRCYSMFATHFHELVKVAAELPTVILMQTEVLEQKDSILFTHRLKEGAVDNSYGLEVARLAGIPSRVLEKAATYLELSPDEQANEKTPGTRTPPRALQGASAQQAVPPLERLGLGQSLGGPSTAPEAELTFAPESPILERLQQLNINRVTPLQALNILSELQSLLGQTRAQSLFSEESC